jgi:protein serine/threonine phosphatase
MTAGEPDMGRPRFQVRCGGRSDRGQVRQRNEDSFLMASPYFLVADGMGGHSHGQEAARAAVAGFQSANTLAWATSDGVIDGINAAAAAVRQISGRGRRPPGSTIAGVGLSLQSGYPCWLVFNVGDSRVYLLRQGELTQVTTDHSVRYVAPGLPSRNVITRALGGGLTKPLLPDQWLIPAQESDQLLICSDGLYGDLTQQLMTAVLLGDFDPQQKADTLVGAANIAGGRDNATAVVVIADVVLPVSGTTADIGETTYRDDDTAQEEFAL